MAAWSEVCVLAAGEGGFTAAVPEAWAQGRSAFGGLVAGLGLRALEALVESDRPLRSLLVSFAGPVAPGLVSVQTQALRAGRALTHAEARVLQDGRVCAVMLGAFGAGRTTAMPPVQAPPPPLAPQPEALPAFPYLEGITPAFTRFLDYRWTSDSLPFGGSDRAHAGGWVRLSDTVPVDAAGVLALLDAWPAPVLALLRRPAAASTVTWMVDLVRPLPPEGVDPRRWWRFEGTAVAGADGYADVEGRLWGPDGGLVASSRQLVVEFS